MKNKIINLIFWVIIPILLILVASFGVRFIIDSRAASSTAKIKVSLQGSFVYNTTPSYRVDLAFYSRAGNEKRIQKSDISS